MGVTGSSSSETSQPPSLNSSSVSRRSPPFPSLSVLASTTVPTLTMSHLPVLMLLSLDPKSSSSSLSTPMTVLRPRSSKTIAEKSHSRARTLLLLAERMLLLPLLPMEATSLLLSLFPLAHLSASPKSRSPRPVNSLLDSVFSVVPMSLNLLSIV